MLKTQNSCLFNNLRKNQRNEVSFFRNMSKNCKQKLKEY